MLAFSVFAYLWLSLELRNPSSKWRILAEFGQASYSLYLVHNVVLGSIADHPQGWSPAIVIASSCTAIAAAAYAFYKLVEAPSHHLARKIAGSVANIISSRQTLKQP
jgi:peptidoglycan/LPS O-acetylase OafA/YrhL